VLYVDADPVFTSAGTAAGIDACLYLVRKEHGSRVANAIARRMVVPPHRDGGQAQYIDRPHLLEETGETVDVVAGRAGFGNATALRHHFRAWRHTTPHAYRHAFRPAADGAGGRGS
jgi:transcriptional regulator GlxA family with amidase domain